MNRTLVVKVEELSATKKESDLMNNCLFQGTKDPLGDEAKLASMTASVLNVTAMLVGVTKTAAVLASHRENDLRSKVR